MDKIEDEKTPKFTAARILFRFIQITDTRCRENLRQRVSIEHKKHVHVSFILNNGKPSPRRVLASCSFAMIKPKKESFQLYFLKKMCGKGPRNLILKF